MTSPISKEGEHTVNPEIPAINGSPWRNRREFSDSLKETTLAGLQAEEQGELFHWNWINIFGEKIAITLDNRPTDESLGPHAVLLMTQGENTDGLELNTIGVRIYEGKVLLPDIEVFDVGEQDQIPYFIEICARALEVGIPPDGIIDAAMHANPRINDPVSDRRTFHDQNLRDFSRQLSERQFL